MFKWHLKAADQRRLLCIAMHCQACSRSPRHAQPSSPHMPAPPSSNALFTSRRCSGYAVRNGHIKRITDNDIRSSVLEVMSTNVSTTFISCPGDATKTLGIKLPFLVMLIKNLKKYFSFEVQVLDDKNVRRRFRASNYQVHTPLRLHHHFDVNQWAACFMQDTCQCSSFCMVAVLACACACMYLTCLWARCRARLVSSRSSAQCPCG